MWVIDWFIDFLGWLIVVHVGAVTPAQVRDRGNGLYDVEYTPDTEGPCTIDVTYAGQPVPNRWMIADYMLCSVNTSLENAM